MEIYVYFQDQSNRIRELRFGSEKGEWYEDSPTGINLLKGLSGTSIACVADSAFGVKRRICSQSAVREVQQCHYEASRNQWSVGMSPILRCSQSLEAIANVGQKRIRISISTLPRASTARLDSDIAPTRGTSESMLMMAERC